MKNSFISGIGARVIGVVMTGALVLGVAGCGGGGSGNTVVDKPGVALFSTANSSLNVEAGASSSYTVGGGGSGGKFVSYTAASSDLKVATASLTGTTLTVKGIASGTATITVADGTGGSLAITVTVPAPTGAGGKLVVNVPGTVTLAPGSFGRYKIVGGTPPYSVAVSNQQAVAVAIEGDSVLATGTNIGTATVAVFDSMGVSSQFSVKVEVGGSAPATLYTSAPATITMQKGVTAPYIIGGGVGPYMTASGDTRIANGSVSGQTLSVTAGIAGTSQLNVVDAVGSSVTVTVKVVDEAASNFYIAGPELVSIAVGTGPTYGIVGGTGPYTVSSGNPSVASAAIGAGPSVSITGMSQGTAQIVVFDSTGLSQNIAVGVTGPTAKIPMFTTAPDSITVAKGASPMFTITGGVAPYTATSSNVAVATSSLTGDKYTVTGINSGESEISIRDSVGAKISLKVIVP